MVWSVLVASVLAGPVSGSCLESSISELRPFHGASGVPVDALPLVVLGSIGCDDATVEVVLSADGVSVFDGQVAGPESDRMVQLLLDAELAPDTEHVLRAQVVGGVDDLDEVSFTTGSGRVAELVPPEILLAGYSSTSEQSDGTWLHQTSWIIDAAETADGLSWGRVLRSDDGSEVVGFTPERTDGQDGVFVPLTFSGELETSLCVVAVSVDAAGRETAASGEHCVDFEQFDTGSGGCSLRRGSSTDATWLLLPLVGWRRLRRLAA
jgi:hypothetical protein